MAGAVLVFGLNPAADDAKKNPIERTGESIGLGRTLFEQNCMVCHGPGGKGDGPAAAGLPAPPADLTYHVPGHPDGTLFKVVTLGVSGVTQKNMPAFEEVLSEEERWHLINYLRPTFGEFTGSGDFVAPSDGGSTPASDATPAGTTAAPGSTATPAQASQAERE